MQARSLVRDRGQRTLLLLIDGQKSEEMLLAHLNGTQLSDFKTLQELGLIAPAQPGVRVGALAPAAPPAQNPAPAAPQAVPEAVPLDYAQFTEALTQIISKQLGLRGFVLTLAVEKAGTSEALQAVAQRTLEQIRDRKGEAAAAAARHALYGA